MGLPLRTRIRIWRTLSSLGLAVGLVASAATAQMTPSNQTAPGQTASQCPTKPQNIEAPYQPVDTRQRLHWAILETVGPQHLIAGLFTAGLGTARDAPHEYGPGWSGFGKRYGIRESGVALSNVMEASIGALWGEDPRYFRVPQLHFGQRLGNVVRQTFVARRPDARFAPAYARYIAFTGNNFISNTWRANSEADTQHALSRTGWAFAGRMASNAYEEFWPDVRIKVFHGKH